jgi:hypothetical protein
VVLGQVELQPQDRGERPVVLLPQVVPAKVAESSLEKNQKNLIKFFIATEVYTTGKVVLEAIQIIHDTVPTPSSRPCE